MVGHHQIVPFAQDVGPVFGRARGPSFAGFVCGGDGLIDFIDGKVGHFGDHVASGRIGHIKGFAAGRFYPSTRHQSLFTDQIRTLQHGFEVCGFVEHSGLP